MRCFPVNTWQTKRGPYHPGQKDDSKGATVAKPGEDDEGVLLDGHRAEAKRTYASSYDVAFIFEQLWKKRTTDSTGAKIVPMSCPEVKVPDTIVYKAGYPASWFFHSKVDGRLLKKKPESIYIPKIFEEFGAENGTCESQVVACFVGTLETTRGPTNSIVYLDKNRLKDFVFGENVMKEGFLQRFVAPEAVPYDNSARNATIHATWSPYNCMVEQRVNKVKLDSKRVGTSAKVNVASNRVETIIVSRHTKLHRKISHQCKLVADHIKATSTDQAEVTNMTCYFKIGENNKLWLLWASSVSVAPKFQDAFGYIPSLKTFTGRHSPVIVCPEHIGTIEKAADSTPPANATSCALCNSTERRAASYAVTYQMLAIYVAAERNRLLDSLKEVTVPAVQEEKVSTRKMPGEIDVNSKGAAIFSVLDLDFDGRIPWVELWSGLMDLGYSAEERNAILGSDPEQMRLSTSESVESPTGTLSSFSGEPGARPVSLAEFVEGLRAMVSIMSPERLARFDTNVDMVGDVVEPDFFAPLADPNDPADTSAHGQYDSSHSLPNGDEDAGQNSLSFARVALRRAKARQLARRLPRLLMNLKTSISNSDLRRIVALETVQDDFAERKVWVCKECAKRFNGNAREVFDWSDEQDGQTHMARVRARVRVLQDLQQLSDPGIEHHYPLGEVPAMCTPRMYQALHSHAERAYVVGPPQITCGGCKDLITQPQNRRFKLPEEIRRKTPLPPLPALHLEIPSTNKKQFDPELTQLMGRMGLTPRQPDKGGRIAQYMQGKRSIVSKSVGFSEGMGGTGSRGNNMTGTARTQAAYAWLPSSSGRTGGEQDLLRTPSAGSGSQTARGRLERSSGRT